MSNHSDNGGFRMRGSFQKALDNYNESEALPNSIYWKNGAIMAFGHLVEILGWEKANQLTQFWTDDRTWKEICLETEKVLDNQKEWDKVAGHVIK